VSGLPDFSLSKHTNQEKMYQMTTTFTKRPQNTPNSRKIYQHFPYKGPPKYTQIGIFGTKTNHLATMDCV
jgi:hypothetical protein